MRHHLQSRIIEVPVLLLLLSLTACSTSRPAETPEILARYDGGEITMAKYEDWRLSKNLPPEARPSREDLETIALTDTLESAALASGLARGLESRMMVEEASDRVLAQALHRKQGEGISFSEERLRAAFDGNPKNQYKPKKYRLREIFLRVTLDTSESSRRRLRHQAEEILTRIRAGEDFSALARLHSDSQTRIQDGYVGLVAPSMLAPKLREAVEKLQEGDTTPVLETPDGFVLLHCDLIVPEKRHTFEKSRAQVETILRRREAGRRWESLQQELLEESAPLVHFSAIHEPESPPGTVVAQWKSGTITRAEASILIERASKHSQSSHVSDARIRTILEARIVEHEAARRARELGLDASAQIRAGLRWAKKEALAAREMRRRVALGLVQARPEEIDKEISTHPSRYRRPPEYLLSVIRLEGEKSDLRRRFHAAEQMVSRLESGELNFEEHAKQVSADPSAGRGGDLGWAPLPRLLSLGSTTAAIIQEMKKGEIRGPIQERDGSLWIIRLRDRHAARPMSDPKARALAVERIESRKTKAIRSQLRKEILSDLEIPKTKEHKEQGLGSLSSETR